MELDMMAVTRRYSCRTGGALAFYSPTCRGALIKRIENQSLLVLDEDVLATPSMPIIASSARQALESGCMLPMAIFTSVDPA